MIQAGDRVAVGVSGGKDSLTLLYAMAKLREFYPLPFELHAITVHPGVPEMDFAPVAALCRELEVPYHRCKRRSFTLFLICAERRTLVPCAPRCAVGPSTTP